MLKRLSLLILSLIMLFTALPNHYVYAETSFFKPVFKNGGIMTLEFDDASYYFIDQDSEVFDNQTNNTLIRFDYSSGERITLAEDVVDFISNGKIIYYISGVSYPNQIWKVNCDGTNKSLIYTLSANSIQYILNVKNQNILTFKASDGIEYELNISSGIATPFNVNNEQILYNYWINYNYQIRPFAEHLEPDDAFLADIDNDNIPELVVFFSYTGPGGPTFAIYKNKNGTVALDGDIMTSSGTGIHHDLKLTLENNGDLKILDYYVSALYDNIGEQSVTLSSYRAGNTIVEKYAEAQYYDNISYSTDITGKNRINCTRQEADEFFEVFYSNLNQNIVFSSDWQQKQGDDFFAIWNTQKNLRDEIKVLLDNKTIRFDQSPIIVNDRTLVPLRAIFEAMGATVYWNGASKTATGYGKQGYNVVVTENSDIAYIDGFPYKLDVPVKNYNGRLLAPARFVAEAFGGYVTWNDRTKTVEIQSFSANVSDNRSYDENARYSTCYDAAMTHGRLVYIADGYKTIVLRNGYIDKAGNQYKFVNSQGISDQRYYFNIVNELVTDYELAKRLDYVYNVNNNEYKGRSEYWTKKVNVNNEMSKFKETYSLAIDLLKTGATFLNAGYVMYDAGKLVFDQMVIGTIYPPYIEASLKNLPADLAKTTTRMGFDGIILCGLVDSVGEFNGYCDTIAEIYNKYGYGYITSLEDAERFMTAVSGQYLLIKHADAVGLYLKTTYPKKTTPGIIGDFATNIVVNFTGTPKLDKIIESNKKLKNVYTGIGEVKTYIEGMNTEGNIIICKNGTDAFFDAQDMIMRNYTLNDTNLKYIELVEKIQ